jgi:hypothetical protein
MLNAWGKSQGEVVAEKPFWQEEIEKSSAMTFYYQEIASVSVNRIGAGVLS